MEPLDAVKQLAIAGRFGDALRTLDAIPISRRGDHRAANLSGQNYWNVSGVLEKAERSWKRS